jgi:hypothetical protein
VPGADELLRGEARRAGEADGARPDDVETAVKTAYRVVDTPGETGEPIRAANPTRTSREVTCASSPPTMLFPCGQLIRNCTLPWAGTTTHGPATGMHCWIPLHSFVAEPAGANAAATASASTSEASAAFTRSS